MVKTMLVSMSALLSQCNSQSQSHWSNNVNQNFELFSSTMEIQDVTTYQKNSSCHESRCFCGLTIATNWNTWRLTHLSNLVAAYLT